MVAVICLVVVGIFAGKNFIINSRATDIVKWCRTWESAQLTYYFKRDKLAGDTNGNGIIADEGEPVSPMRELVRSKVINESKMKVGAGDSIFHIKIGYDTTKGIKRNVFVICPSSACERPIEGEEVILMEMIDDVIDGEMVVSEGDIRGVVGVSLVAEGEGVTDVREAIESTSWNESAYVGAVYYFEDYMH
jgi:hypothetical protein